VTDNVTAQRTKHQREQADYLAFPMFMLSVVFLLLLAGIIITWVDIPRVAELAQLDTNDIQTQQHQIDEALKLANSASYFGSTFFITLLILWPLFWIEFAYSYTTARNKEGARKTPIQPLLACLIPPLRLGKTSSAWDDRLWLPSLTWQHPGRELSALLTRIFGKPMLIIALLILPILLIEFVFKNAVQQYFWLRLTLHLATGFIWFAFTFEFIIMISATDKKLAHTKKNWIDLAIILIPFISFLRTLRVLRLAKLAKIQKIAKLGRVYRVRGLGMKAMRALMMFEFVNRLLRISPQKQLAKLKAQQEELSLEMADLDGQIAALEQRIDEDTKID